ncbi:uncharacterized protein KZ484_026723 [Pholidichthys leucotaenia]
MTSVSTLKSHRLDVLQQNDSNQEEILDEQQLLNQERNIIVVQVGADCSQIKEEQEDVCISREGEQFGLKQETHAFDEDAPQLHDCEEEVLTVQQLCNQEEQDAAQVKEEGEELRSSREEEDLGLKQETDTFMVTPTDEDSDKNETEPDSEQLLSHNSPDTESQDQGAGKNVNPRSSKDEEPQPKKRLHRKRSDRDNVDNSMPENQCDTDTGEKSRKCSDDKDCKNESQKKKHHIVKSHVYNMCVKRFRMKSALSVDERIHTDEKPFSCSCHRVGVSLGLHVLSGHISPIFSFLLRPSLTLKRHFMDLQPIRMGFPQADLKSTAFGISRVFLHTPVAVQFATCVVTGNSSCWQRCRNPLLPDSGIVQ